MRIQGAFAVAAIAMAAFGQTPEVRVMSEAEKSASLAMREAARSARMTGKSGAAERAIPVTASDVVIPQVADGSGWKTTMTFINLRSTDNQFEVLFFTDTGGDMNLTFPGVGTASSLRINLPPNQSLTVETAGVSGALSQGWAYLNTLSASIDVGSLTVFRQRVAGKPDFEAAVPTVSEFDKRFVMPFDNAQNFTTAVAISNSDLSAIGVEATIRDENGNVLVRDQIIIQKLSKAVVVLPARWGSTANRRGWVEFRSSGLGASAIGLRFNPDGAFTSFHMMTNQSWITP